MNYMEIILFPVDDEITLEYDDQILLRFTPNDSNIVSALENGFEYIRDSAIVNIIDNDSEWVNYLVALFIASLLCSVGDQFHGV